MHEITIGNPIKKSIEMWIDGFNSNISSVEFKPELHGFVVKKMDDIVLQNQKSTSPNPYGAPLSSEQWVSVKTNMCEKKKIHLMFMSILVKLLMQKVGHQNLVKKIICMDPYGMLFANWV